MKSRILLFLAIIAITVLFLSCKESSTEPVLNHSLELKGFTYTSFSAGGFRLGHQSNAVTDMVNQTGTEWIALSVFEYQSTPSSHDIAPNTTGRNPITNAAWSTTSTGEDLLQAVTDIRSLGRKIMLKPHVDLYSGEWRAAIQPDTAWFSAYLMMILKYAQFAQENQIEMLCIGDEFVVATQHQFTSRWRDIIAEIRRIYSGKLTYAANWSGAYDEGITTAEYLQVEFWNDLDYIGIDAYYPVTNSAANAVPTLEAATARLSSAVLQTGLAAAAFRKPVILTEIGIQSVKGALAEPWNYRLGSSTDAVQDNSVQEFYYRAVIETWGKQSWCAGIFWWNWESIATSNEKTNYTPRNKTAATVLKRWYVPQSS